MPSRVPSRPPGPPAGRPPTGRGRPAEPPPEPPRPKAFEIRRGKANPDEAEEREAPLGAVLLPRSITQEAEEERLKERFGVDHLPEVQAVNSLVRMTESQGTLGPDRARRRLIIVVLLLLAAAAGGAAFAHQRGLLQGLLPQ
ncbi:MAG: hypothetical protein M9894_32520 [Planctomycetes bacterium]|nr:hypothetical protein [Planctomycetota bacterium]